MLKIRIYSINDGSHIINLSAPTTEIPYMFAEFFGEVTLTGVLVKSGRHYKFTGVAKCNANLICDISATDYVEEIKSDITLSMIANTNLYFMQKKDIIDYDKTVALHEEEAFFDISELVKDELATSLPLKRVAPTFRGKNFSDLYPEYSSS